MITKTLRTLLLIGFVWALTALTSFAADPTGKWTWTNTGPKGRELEAHLTLELVDGKLSGSIKNRAGEARISDATFENGRIAFSVVRELRKRTFTTHYKGVVEADVIKGTLETTLRGDQPVSVVWEARREP